MDEWSTQYPKKDITFGSGVAPHAGWAFSGALAFAVIQQFPEAVDTVAVVGGHLPSGSGVLVAPEDHYDTPFGDIPADAELRNRIVDTVDAAADRLPDNTVEVHLPIVRHLFPNVRGLYLRCPPSPKSSAVGKAVADYAKATGRIVAVVGSTDLTHYGPDYGFEPHGSPPESVEWVTNVNDRLVIDALEEQDSDRVLEAGTRNKAACSAGGANTAAAFARTMGYEECVVVDHYTSYDVFPRRSFVGYVGLGYVRHDA